MMSSHESATRRVLRWRTGFGRISVTLAAGALICAISGASPANTGAFDIARHRGKVVIVDFWASWCKPCRQSIPWLNAMRSRYGVDGLEVVGINVDAKRSDADRFLREVPIEFELVFDPRGELAKEFEVRGMPSSYVFDRAGKLVQTHLGFRDAKKEENEAALKALLQRPVQ
jgi:cytochrome c biogenesis protein CcmG, thiol:disulfide interchange protein DsbE